jgi:hypothetical protein
VNVRDITFMEKSVTLGDMAGSGHATAPPASTSQAYNEGLDSEIYLFSPLELHVSPLELHAGCISAPVGG